jgi:signal transduction histidine kinase/CheY-like chemotaxis protein
LWGTEVGNGIEIRGHPGVFPVRGLPPSIVDYRDAENSGSGWVFSGGNGVVFQSDVWRSWAGTYGSNMGCAAPLKSGSTLLAGYGFCSVLSPEGKEKVILDKGAFYSLASDGVTSLVASSTKVYAVTENGAVASLNLTTGAGLPYVHNIKGRLVLFAPGDGIFVFANGAFRPTSDYKWAAGQEMHSIVPVGNGSGFFALTNRSFYSATEASRVTPVFTDLLARLRGRAVDGAVPMGRELIVSSYFDGLTGYSTEDQSALWVLPPSEFGGSIYFLRPVKDGVMVGSSSGIAIVPDPSRYLYCKIPVADFNSVVASPKGPLLLLGDKVYQIDGQPLNFPAGTVAVAPFERDYAVASFGGTIHLPNGKTLALEDKDLPLMVPYGEGFAVVHNLKLSIYENGAFSKVALPGAVDSIAEVDTQLLLGTDHGAILLSPYGQVDATIGVGHTTVRSLGDHRAVALDSQGHLYDSTGFQLGTLPFSELQSAVSWNGATVLLGRLRNGSSAIVRMTTAGMVSNLDLPVEGPLALAVDKGKLCVVCPGFVLQVSEADALTFPAASPTVTALSGSSLLSLRSAEDTVLLKVPPARLGPWISPTYQYQVGDGKWENVAAGAQLQIPRLSYGRSQVNVRAALGDQTKAISFSIERAYPLWMQWPAFVGYACAGSLAFLGLLRWRTKRLGAEAARLQGLVDEKTADLKRAQAAREEFFSSLSHEIRNPLNGVVGLCSILAEAPPGSIGPREKRIVSTLQGCAGQLRSMLDDVLDFSRIDRGDIQLSTETFDLGAAVEGSVRSVDVDLANAELVVPADPVWVSGDCGKLRQIVTNLASNGLKYGIPPRIRVTLAAQVTRDGKLSVQIAVSNTGATIPEKDLANIFKGFARGEDAIRRRIPGHGLGLAVSRRMAEAMGGSLTVQSHEGLTIFTLAVLLAISDAPFELAATVHKPRLSKALAIEDEPYNRTVLGHILSQLGYEVDWAVDGASAMERIRSEHYDLVLTDYLLPDTTGAELAGSILMEAPNPKPPVIAVTAYSTVEKIAELKAAGVSQIVTKPVSLEKLRSAIMALSNPTGRRSLDVAPARVACNFLPLLAATGNPDALATYADDLLQSWSLTVELAEVEGPESAKAVHAFLSRVLVVEAKEAAALVSQLESAVRLARSAEARRLSDLLNPIIEEIAAKARAQAKKAVR